MGEKDFDKKLANKFRETFSDYEVAYSQADWDKLSPKLHKSPLMKVWRNPRIISLAVAASIALLYVSYFLVKENTEKLNTIESQYAENEVIDSTQIEPVQIRKTEEKVNKNTFTPKEHIAKTEILKDGDTQTGEKAEKRTVPTNTPIIAAQKTTTNKDKNRKQLKNIPLDNALAKNTEKELKEEATKNITAQNEVPNKEKEEKIVVAVMSIASAQIDSILFAYKTETPAGNMDLILRELSNKVKKQKVNIPFTLGIALNPLVYKNAIDTYLTTEMGLQLSIPLAKRLRLTAGALIANQRMQYKNEKHIRKELFFGYDSIKSSVGINSSPRESIVATSSEMRNNLLIINIPINLQYSFWYGEKVRLFTSIGVSNYAYLIEKYQFVDKISKIYYRPDNDNDNHLVGKSNLPPAISSGEIFSEYKHESFSQIDFFGGLNLSVGIDYLLSKHFSIQASPFIRLPLKEIGSEKLNFDTFGMALVLNYK